MHDFVLKVLQYAELTSAIIGVVTPCVVVKIRCLSRTWETRRKSDFIRGPNLADIENPSTPPMVRLADIFGGSLLNIRAICTS